MHRDKEASLIWVTYQRCGGHLKEYNTRKYWNAISPHSIIATIPGTCEDHYAKDALCNNVRKLPGAMDEGDIGGVIPCWVLPTHRDSLNSFLGQHSDKYFIVKRKAESSAKGTVILKGEDLIQRESSLLKAGGVTAIVQRYYSDPYLKE